MAVREFTQGEYVEWSIGTGGLAALAQGPFTVAAIAKRIGTPALTGGLLSLENAGVSRALYRYTDGDAMDYLRGSFDSPGDGPGWSATDGWCRVAFTRAAGTSAVRYHIRPEGGSWTHADSAGTVGDDDQTADSATTRPNSDNDIVFRGRYAVMAAWNSVLSDVAIENLDAAYADWVAASPIALWRFDQATTADPVDDQAGNGADQATLVGSTVVVGDDPPGFTFQDAAEGTAAFGLGLQLQATGSRPSAGTATAGLGLALAAAGARDSAGAAGLGLGLRLQATGSRPSRGQAHFVLGLLLAGPVATVTPGVLVATAPGSTLSAATPRAALTATAPTAGLQGR